MSGDVFTTSGPTLEEEIRDDADKIDRKIVRTSLRYRPNWTGVQWKVTFRTTWKVYGETFVHEEPIGLLSKNMDPKERDKLRKKVDIYRDHVHDLIAELGLERRAATHGTYER